MTLLYKETLDVWNGERIDDILYQVNIDQLWTEDELSAIGLVKPEPFIVPEGFNKTGAVRYERDGDTVKEVYDVIAADPEEVIPEA